MKTFLFILFAALLITGGFAANFILLNGKIVQERVLDTNKSQKLEQRVVFLERQLSSTPNSVLKKTEEASLSAYCPTSCLGQIELLKRQIAGTDYKVTPIPTITPQTTSFLKEIYIPLGSGKYKGQDYKTVGAYGFVDLSNYGKIKEAFFEAILSVPTSNGLMYARLINVTDSNTPVANSEITTGLPSSSLISSTKINLAYGGKKLYSVQLRTTMDYEGVMDFARIRIVLD